MLAVTFLGTSAARPTVERNVSAIAVAREGETLLFDCGEGTQRQMMRYGVSFTLNEIFLTHFHADHYLGLVGLIRTLGLQGREEVLRVFGPPGARRIVAKILSVGVERTPFPVEVEELEVGARLVRTGYDLVAFPVEHGRSALGYVLREHDRLGRFDPAQAHALGVPEGPLWGRLHRGETVTLDDGRVIDPAQLVGPARPGRTVVLSGDTAPTESVIDASRNADLLVHEATFLEEEVARARETDHSTALDAAKVAAAAGARRLVLTHVSARHSVNAEALLEEACTVFPETTVARDGLRVEVPFADASPTPQA